MIRSNATAIHYSNPVGNHIVNGQLPLGLRQTEKLLVALPQIQQQAKGQEHGFLRGKPQLGFTPEETMLLPFGLLLDLWECHKQFLGLAKPKRELTIDDVIPYGI